MDPFQMLMVCIITITSVTSKMFAYLHKFTENYLLSIALPCAISVICVFAPEADLGITIKIANYVATFFAYQFLVIIPFGLFYLRCTQLTAEE